MGDQEILDAPLETLGFSVAFLSQSREMGFADIRSIVKLSGTDLIQLESFTYHWLEELSRYMISKRLIHLLQPATGKIDD